MANETAANGEGAAQRGSQRHVGAPGDTAAGNTPIFGPDSFASVMLSWRRWWRDAVIGTVDQASVIEKRREEAYTSPRYLFMLAMSAGIAVLGLLLSSPAVVIGAMLIAPLMGPIIGAGFALAIGDYKWLRGSVRALVSGTVLAVALCALIVFVSPLQTVTPEIAARTRPNLFDLGVAVFSALAGAYSMIRGREGTIVGVAIATALMPPLAVAGFGLATTNWTVFSGALLLFVTNLMTIALVATIMARIYGFSAELSERQTRFQTILIVTIFVALAIPLFLSLRQIAWETNAARQIRSTVLESFDGDARISQLSFDLEAEPVTVDATVLTPRTMALAERDGEGSLAVLLGRPVDLRLTQFRVGTQAEAEAAEIAAADARAEEADAARAEAIAANLALVAGVPRSEVLVDRQNRRATVRANPLDGATLAAYRTLERRIADGVDGWRIELRPPLRALPPIAFEARLPEEEVDADGAAGEVQFVPTEEGATALALVGWAGARVDAPIALTGPERLVAIVEDRLRRQGIELAPSEIVPGGLRVVPRWTAPVE
ncbi:TIGR00341 family protein [Parapontixanthobacter aurantiacus]|nr:TIGR00341 family protein [Parapontixanthobacter aurantiacus]